MKALSHLTSAEIGLLEELKGRLLETLGNRLSAFRLFGSKARGDYDPESDLDVAIIVDGLTKETKNGILDLIAGLEMKHLVVVSALVLSLQDFEQLRQDERRIALDIEREGIPL